VHCLVPCAALAYVWCCKNLRGVVAFLFSVPAFPSFARPHALHGPCKPAAANATATRSPSHREHTHTEGETQAGHSNNRGAVSLVAFLARRAPLSSSAAAALQPLGRRAASSRQGADATHADEDAPALKRMDAFDSLRSGASCCVLCQCVRASSPLVAASRSDSIPSSPSSSSFPYATHPCNRSTHGTT
jgi:hypothetical protein